MIDDREKQSFQSTVWEYYHSHGRHNLPWRLPAAGDTFDPYSILVSEIMLQQTQVSRVIPKYLEFLKQFPDVNTLAEAEQGAVLRAWNGLGYNRRARFLHLAAKNVVAEYGGNFPETIDQLVKLPGIGVNTAGAILAYAHNRTVVFLETNIRTVFIHHFFNDREGVTDKEIARLVEQTVDEEHPREWYWALMDYGSYLKQIAGNLNRLSKSYTRQSKFAGSKRQVRGEIIRILGDEATTLNELSSRIPDPRLEMVVDDLLREGLITRKGKTLAL